MDGEGDIPVWPPPAGAAEDLAVGCESGEQREAWAELYTWMSSTQAPIKPTAGRSVELHGAEAGP